MVLIIIYHLKDFAVLKLLHKEKDATPVFKEPLQLIIMISEDLGRS